MQKVQQQGGNVTQGDILDILSYHGSVLQRRFSFRAIVKHVSPERFHLERKNEHVTNAFIVYVM